VLVGIVGLENDLLVRCEAEPLQPLKDRAGRFLRGARKVRILDPNKKLAAGAAGIKIIKKSGPS